MQASGRKLVLWVSAMAASSPCAPPSSKFARAAWEAGPVVLQGMRPGTGCQSTFLLLLGALMPLPSLSELASKLSGRIGGCTVEGNA